MAEGYDDLLAQFTGPRVPGQPRLPVSVNVAEHRIELCGEQRSFDPQLGNRGVLEAFVEVVEAVRKSRPQSTRQLRRVDLAELGRVLDLSDRELEADLETVLGVSDDRARGIADRLHRGDRARRTDRLHNMGAIRRP